VIPEKSKWFSADKASFDAYVKTGLSSHEVERKRQQYGSNEIPEKKVNPIRKFLGYFWGPIPWMIEAAAALSVAIQHWEDFAIIFTLLIVNAVVGFWQEHKADNAIELLKKRLAPKARVLRDSKWLEIPAKELVPDDIVRLRLGDIVPADAKLMQGDYLLLDESALTGESLPAEKRISDIAYSGSIVRQGEMNAQVVATGISSYFGRTTKLVEEAKTGSHFQKARSQDWQPLPKGCYEDRRLLDCSCSRNGFNNFCCGTFPAGSCSRNLAVCAGLSSGSNTCSFACSVNSYHGNRSHCAR